MKQKKKSKTGKIILILIELILLAAIAAGVFIVSAQHRETYKADIDTSAVCKAAENAAKQAANEAQAAKEKREKALADPTIRILMVDNDDVNERVADRFEKIGCQVTTVYDLDEVDADRYDALVIPGGGNVTPSEYGEERSEFTSDTDLEKDELQIAAVKRFVDVKKPVLGLCRGNQLINVAFGGTIDQGNGEYHEGWHKVIIAEGSLMYDTFGGEVDAYHYHKQQVKDLGKGLIATQWDADDPDLIEGFEHETLPVYGVQWHPDAIKMHETGERAFEAFKNVVAENKGLTDTQ